MNGRVRNGDNYPDYPEITERIGENPARFLSTSLDARPRIRGISDVESIRAWQEVAVDELDGDELRSVMAALNQRQAELNDRVASDGGHDE